MIQVETCILLKRINYSDSSFILTFYCKNKGIKKVIFKGGKKKKVHLIPFGKYEITFTEKLNDSLGILISIQNLVSFKQFNDNPNKSLIAFFCADYILSTMKESDPEGDLFDCYSGFVSELCESDKPNYNLIPLRIIASSIVLSGYKPLIGENYKPFFNLLSAELNPSKSDSCVHINVQQYGLLSDLFENTLSESYSNADLKYVFQLLLSYCSYHLPHIDVRKSTEIIQEIIYD